MAYEVDGHHPLFNCYLFLSAEIMQMPAQARYDFGYPRVCIGACCFDNVAGELRIESGCRLVALLPWLAAIQR